MVLAQNTSTKDLYEGFAMDLIEQISIKGKFRYDIIVTDIEYGKEDPVTKEWSGIVGNIVSKVLKKIKKNSKSNSITILFKIQLIRHRSLQKADLAIGDITITHARKTAIDFSTPFMTLGMCYFVH